MPRSEAKDVTVRVRIGENEIQVTGPQAYVDQRIQQFIESARQSPKDTPPHPTLPKQAHGSPAATSGKPLSPAQFFKKYNLKSDVDRVLLAGYFLEKHRNSENFTAAEIRQLISEAKVPPPINPSDSINKNIKKAVMMPAGERDNKLAFVLTSDGESTVEQLNNQQSE